MSIRTWWENGKGTGATQTGILTPFNPDNHLSSIVLQDLWPDLDPSYLPPSRAAAMRLGAASRGRSLITGAIAGMPILTYRGSKLIPSRGLAVQPEPGRPRAVTMAWTVDQMLWHGRAWWAVTSRDGHGKASAVELVVEERIAYDAETDTISVDGGRPQPSTAFVRIDAMHEGVLSTAWQSIQRATAIEAAAARAGDNPVPSVELHQVDGDPLTRPQVNKLVADWAAARRGSNGGVAYTNQSIEARMHGSAAEQLLIDGRNVAALDIARHLNLPAWAVDATVTGSSLTYSNVPSRSRELLDYTLQPYMDAIAGRLSMDDLSARGVWYRLDPSRLLRGDFASRMAAAKTAVESGMYTTEELRLMDNETPLEGE